MAGENVNHFGAVRIRVVGDGDLQMSWESLNDVIIEDLKPLTMQSANYIQPTRLSNFKSQRARLVIKTTEINEFFRINRLVLFVRPIYTSYPGTD